MRCIGGSLFGLLTALLVALPASTQETESEGHGVAGAVLVAHEGSSGLWFPLDMARAMQSDLEVSIHKDRKLNLMSLKLEAKEEIIWHQKAAMELLMQQNDDAYSLAATAMEAQEIALEQLERDKEKRNPVWKHPAIWFTVGAVVAVLLTYGSVKVMQASD